MNTNLIIERCLYSIQRLADARNFEKFFQTRVNSISDVINVTSYIPEYYLLRHYKVHYIYFRESHIFLSSRLQICYVLLRNKNNYSVSY